MLVLSRKTLERIQIGDNIVVTVLRVKGNVVRIGIEAPSDVRVRRGELPVKQNETSSEEDRSSPVDDLPAPLANFVKRD